MKKFTRYKLALLAYVLFDLLIGGHCGGLLPLGMVAAAQSGPPAIGNITSAGSTCSTTSVPTNCVILQLDGATSAATIQVAGTYVGTNQFEVSSDNQNTWSNVSCTPPNSATAVSSTTSTGLWQCNVAGYTHVRARASAYTSGTAAININSAHSVPSIVTGVSGATTTTSGTASAVTQPGYPMICDTATSGTVTAGQAQMVRCTPAGILSTMVANQNGDTVSSASEGALVFAAGTVAALQVTPKLFNGTNFSRPYVASLANYATAATSTARNEAGAQITEKGSRWGSFSNPAAGSQATISLAAEASVRHVADCVSFSAAATTAPALTALTINLRDGATGAGTILQTWQVAIPATTGTLVAPLSVCGLNLVGTTNTAMTLEFSASLANLIESVSLTAFNVN